MRWMILLLIASLVVAAGCAPTPKVAPSSTDESAQVTQPVQSEVPVKEPVIPPPVEYNPQLPEVKPSDNMTRPEASKDGQPTEQEKVASQQANMDSGATIIGTEGEDMIRAVACDLENNKLSFSLVNQLDRGYSLESASVFNLPDGIYAMRFTINGRHQRDLPEHCGGATRLMPGDMVQCSYDFAPDDIKNNVMIRTRLDEFGKPTVNYLQIASSYDQSQVQFVCRAK